jgi:Fuc2NAc and GlcNAc transferase
MTYLIKEYAIKKSFLAKVNERSSHHIPTPHGGGIAIAISWFIGLIYLYIHNNIDQSLFYALMIGIFISILSFLDDIYELSMKIRLFFQAIVALCALYLLGGLEYIDVIFFNIENMYITTIFAFLLILWFINLYNFLDGIDGYAGSEAVFLAIAAFVVFGGEYFLILSASVTGFLIWNWHRAKIFMGDVGSTLLGYNTAVFTIYYSNIESSNIWIWAILFSVFWVDATMTLYRRYKNGEKLSQAHKQHIYQRLNQMGWSHSKVTLGSVCLNVILFVILMSLSNIYIASLISFLILYSLIKYIDKKELCSGTTISK